jgi:hypothetical protein
MICGCPTIGWRSNAWWRSGARGVRGSHTITVPLDYPGGDSERFRSGSAYPGPGFGRIRAVRCWPCSSCSVESRYDVDSRTVGLIRDHPGKGALVRSAPRKRGSRQAKLFYSRRDRSRRCGRDVTMGCRNRPAADERVDLRPRVLPDRTIAVPLHHVARRRELGRPPSFTGHRRESSTSPQ